MKEHCILQEIIRRGPNSATKSKGIKIVEAVCPCRPPSQCEPVLVAPCPIGNRSTTTPRSGPFASVARGAPRVHLTGGSGRPSQHCCTAKQGYAHFECKSVASACVTHPPSLDRRGQQGPPLSSFFDHQPASSAAHGGTCHGSWRHVHLHPSSGSWSTSSSTVNFDISHCGFMSPFGLCHLQFRLAYLSFFVA